MYQLPFGVNVSAFYNARQGYPYERACTVRRAPTAPASPRVLLDPVGDSRLPNYQNLDFHVERPLKFGTVALRAAIDVFNLFNTNTIQAIRGTQNAANANHIQALTRAARAALRRPGELVVGRRSGLQACRFSGRGFGPRPFFVRYPVLACDHVSHLVRTRSRTRRSAPIPISRSPR